VNSFNYHTIPEENFRQKFLVNLAPKNTKKSNFGQKKLTSQKNLKKL
jgi:hypothetical protein